MFYYSGLNVSPPIIPTSSPDYPVIEKFSEIKFDNIIDVTISWNYFLLWQTDQVFISGNVGEGYKTKLLTIPEAPEQKLIQGLAGKEYVTFLSENREIWQYHVYENNWKKIDNFIIQTANAEEEYIIKIAGYHNVTVLTNLGRIFNIPNLAEMPKRVKFVDVACGFEHIIMLADNGDIYSMGAGSRGQLGHGDLEDYDEPTLINALAGLKVVQISAGGWHSAVITEGGDLYTWGWSTDGEIGVQSDRQVFAVPTVIDFKDKEDKPLEVEVKNVQCGNVFTMCLSKTGFLYGSGSNKYGQLGQPHQQFPSFKKFTELEVNFDKEKIELIKCQEWGSLIKVK